MANEAQSQLNAELSAHLDKGISLASFKSLRRYLNGTHGITHVRKIETAEDVGYLIALLISENKIEVGAPNGYKLLIDGLRSISERALADDVEKYQGDIAKAGTSGPGHATSGAAAHPPGGSTATMTQSGNTISGKNISNLHIDAKGGNIHIG